MVLTVVPYLRDDDHIIRGVGGVYTEAWHRLAESGNPDSDLVVERGGQIIRDVEEFYHERHPFTPSQSESPPHPDHINSQIRRWASKSIRIRSSSLKRDCDNEHR